MDLFDFLDELSSAANILRLWHPDIYPKDGFFTYKAVYGWLKNHTKEEAGDLLFWAVVFAMFSEDEEYAKRVLDALEEEIKKRKADTEADTDHK